jgi:hypothetical protein
VTTKPLLERARTIALDSSHFAGLVLDWSSAERTRRDAATQFLQELARRGWILLLYWHHIEELLQHHDEALVDRRLNFLRSLPFIAWIRPKDPAAGPGSILDVLGAEVLAAHLEPDADLWSVRDRVRNELLMFGPASDAIPGHFADWRLLRHVLEDRQQNSRKVAAISRWRSEPIENTPIAEWARGRPRSLQDVAPTLDRLRSHLTQEIRERGDKRIADPHALAGKFFLELSADMYASTRRTEHPAAIQILLDAGLSSQELKNMSTVGEAVDRVVFYKHLALIADTNSLDLDALKATVQPERLPVKLIERCIRLHGQDPPERKGSELNDVHLLCLAPYVDRIYVDKRTWESVRQARQKQSDFGRLVGDVRKAKTYRAIQSELSPR